MPKITARGIELAYERAGDPAAPTLLLLNGLGGQLTSWDDDFIAAFLQRGYGVLRLDHRDTGLSTRWTKDRDDGPPMTQRLAAAFMRQPVPTPYTLADLADDAVALLQALQIERAHVVGVSMGGMIAQLMALRSPDRVASLTSIMSTTNEPGLPPAAPQAMARLMSPIPTGRAEHIARLVETFRVIGSPPPLFDEDRVRARATRGYDRSFHPAGFLRHLLAIATTPGRAAALGALSVPALVIHGERDPLIPVACGRATAAAIPGARLLVLPEMGHDLPYALWPEIITAICDHAAAAASGG